MKRQNLRTVALVVVTFTYLLFGAAIFGYLESDHEQRQREALEFIERIIRDKYNISDDDYTVLTTTVIKSVPHKAGIQWKFPGAFYFATTVVTTIGYGHSTPSTVSGRSFCMAYALIGIPLGLIMFQSIGERLNTIVGAALRWAKRCCKSKNPEVTPTNLVMVVSVLSTILMTSMAAVFAKYERWDYFDALYYCFITLTTIGFGDYVALQKESALQSKPEYVILSLVFILFGLSVVSSAVNLLVLKFLTLNTEDERRDEQLRNTAAMNPIQLEGDVITSSGKLEYVGGARRPPPALTMSQAMARSSIKREREALIAASWQRPIKKPPPPRDKQPNQQSALKVQSPLVGSSETIIGSRRRQRGSRRGNEPGRRRRTPPAEVEIQAARRGPAGRETTSFTVEGADDRSELSDNDKDNERHRAECPFAACGRFHSDGRELDDELYGLYLQEMRADELQASLCCNCQHEPASDMARPSLSRIPSGAAGPMCSPRRTAPGQWIGAKPRQDEFLFCLSSEQTTAGEAGTVRDLDSLSIDSSAAMPAQLAHRVDARLRGQSMTSQMIASPSSSTSASLTHRPLDEVAGLSGGPRKEADAAALAFSSDTDSSRLHRRHGRAGAWAPLKNGCDCDEDAQTACHEPENRECLDHRERARATLQHFRQSSNGAPQQARLGGCNGPISPPRTWTVARLPSRAAPDRMMGPTSQQANQAPQTDQSCSCSWVSLGLASPEHCRAGLGDRSFTTPTFANLPHPPTGRSQDSASCLVLDPQSLESHSESQTDLSQAQSNWQRSLSGDCGARRRQPPARFSREQTIAISTTTSPTGALCQSAPAVHESAPPPPPGSHLPRAAPSTAAAPDHHQSVPKTIIPTKVAHQMSAVNADDGQDYGRPQIQRRANSGALCPAEKMLQNEPDEKDLDSAAGLGLSYGGERATAAEASARQSKHAPNRKLTTSASSDMRKRSSSSSSHRQQRPVIKLVCRCCCQHAECIEYALKSANERQPPKDDSCERPANSLNLFAQDAPTPADATNAATFQGCAPVEANCDSGRSVEINMAGEERSDLIRPAGESGAFPTKTEAIGQNQTNNEKYD